MDFTTHKDLICADLRLITIEEIANSDGPEKASKPYFIVIGPKIVNKHQSYLKALFSTTAIAMWLK